MNMGMLFQGIATLFEVQPVISITRIVLILVGIIIFYLGFRNVLEPLIMIPMGFGMAVVNCSVLYLSATQLGNIIIDPMVSGVEPLMDILQIDFLL